MLVAASAAAMACGDSGGIATPDPVARPASLQAISGDYQDGIAGQILPEPLVVQVADSSDSPLPGQPVAFLVVAGGGSISADTVLTNSSGMAEVQWTLGPTAGQPQTIYARVADVGSGAPVLYTTFNAVAEPAFTGLKFQSVRAGVTSSCGLTAQGQAYCWGSGFDGTDHPIPNAVDGGLTFATIAMGWAHICGLTPAGAAYCWGQNERGQLGDGSHSSTSGPRLVSGGLVFREIATGVDHTCALTTEGAAYCWGGNSAPFGGQLGDGTMIDRLVPTRVLGGLTFKALALGASASCGITRSGAAYCWGSRLGLHNGDSDLRPAAVGGGLSFVSISATLSHVCGLVAGGTAYCWGSNLSGELGDGTETDSPTPVAVAGGLTFATISAGGNHTCGLTPSGALTCWGWDDTVSDSKEFNGGISIQSTTPVVVPGGHTFVALSEGIVHGCGIDAGHSAYCWFDDSNGALGNGHQSSSYQPVPVR